jgi:glyoxylase-like metal-dependent hydrolase (beta-lactamase superfamily II)
MTRAAERSQTTVGGTTVTYLPDGEGWMDASVIFPASAPDGWAPYPAFLDAAGRIPVSIGSFLIRTGGRVILVDLGLGAVDYEIPGVASFAAGRLPASLAAEGLAPGDVDTVVFTHLHHDHVGWTSDVAPDPEFPEGAAVGGLGFPNARHLVAEAEWRYWADKGVFPGPDRRAVLEPLAGRIGFVGDGDEIAPGVRVLATPGHTPGHISLLVTDPEAADRDAADRNAADPEATDPEPADPRRLVVLGDVMHCQVQVTESRWSFVWDFDADQALRTRERLLRELQNPDTVLAGGHFADHVFGRVLPPDTRRLWADGRLLG